MLKLEALAEERECSIFSAFADLVLECAQQNMLDAITEASQSMSADAGPVVSLIEVIHYSIIHHSLATVLPNHSETGGARFLFNCVFFSLVP